MKKVILYFMFLTVVFFSATAQRTVSGKVTDDSGEGLPGVNVVVKGTTTGTTTDLDGNYRLSVDDDAALIFSFVGFETQEAKVGARSIIDIAMSGIVELDEVVVVGYGDQSQRLSTQSVSVVTAENIQNLPVLSTQEALQGQAAGVEMIGANGIIGSRPTVRIRGVASLEGTQPLYVLDGVPMVNERNSLPRGGVEMNPLATINPGEIESISVLKDASAVAIYGSRGSNGVILINTKKGKRNQPARFTADWYTGWVNATQTRQMMNADQYRQFSADVLTARTGTIVSPTDKDVFPQTSYDWPAAVLRTGSTNNYSLSASGGGERTSYFVSGNYFKQKGFTIGNEGDRINFRSNMDHSATDNITFGANIGITRLEYDRLDQDNSVDAPLTTAYLIRPWTLPTDEEGDYVNTGFPQNVIGIEALSTFEFIQRRTTGNFYAQWDIIDNLTFKSDFGMDANQSEETLRTPDVLQPGGYGYKRIFQENKYLITNSLRYIQDFNDNMTLSLLLAHSWEESRTEIMTVEASGFVTDELPNVASASTPTITSATGSGWGLESMFGRVNYSFLDKYLFEGTIRRDGSSRFGTNNRYGTFWAVSGGWVISEEPFLAGLDNVINFLKLKVSYGTSGNDQFGVTTTGVPSNFPSLGLYGAGTIPNYNGTPGSRPLSPANPDLTWEETAQLDISLSAGLFSDRVFIDASYYVKKTDGLLLDVPIPYTTGFATIPRNIGKIENKGVDLRITGDIVSTSDLKVTSTLNLGFLDNTVTFLPDDNLDVDKRAFVEGSFSQRAVVGHSLNSFYLIRYVGIDPETGEAQWLDAKGEITQNPVADDRKIVGDAIPNLTGSFNTKVIYKGFDFSFLFTFVQGNEVFLDDLRFSDNPRNSYIPRFRSGFNLSTRLFDYWKEPGDQPYAPKLDANTFNTFAQRSSQQLFDGSYIRLKNISLGYSLPESILDNTFLDRVRIYVMGTNLLTFASELWDFGFEPEINGGETNPGIQGESFFTAPQARTISVGVNLGF